MLALDVAASAPSPRKRPTQIALMVPFSDWRIEEASVGSAKASRVLADRPCVRSPRFGVSCVCHRSSCPLRRQGPSRCQGSASRCVWTPAFAGVRSAQPLQRRAQAFGLGGFGVMVGAGFLDRLGLGALGEVGVGEALRRGCRVPSRRPPRLSTGAPSRRRGRSRSASGKAIVSPRRRRSAPTPVAGDIGDELDRFRARAKRVEASRHWRSSRSTRSSPTRRSRIRCSLALRRDVQLGRASTRTSLTSATSQSSSALALRIDLRLRLRPFGDDQVVGPLVRVPQLLGDERHQRVEHHQDLVERPGGDALVSSSNAPLISSTYQSQKVPQTKW